MTRLITLFFLGSLATGCDAYYAPYRDSGDSGDTGDESSTPDCEPFGSDNPWQQTGGVYGRVVSPSGSVPVLSSLVEVQIGSDTAWVVTRCDGDFHLELPEGAHTVVVSKGRYTARRSVDVKVAEDIDLGTIVLEAPNVQIAVITGQYDDIGALVAHAGLSFDNFTRPSDILDSQATLDNYDVVFVNCGTMATTTNHEDYTSEQFTRLRDWIERGGTLYTSDWEWELFEGVAPEALDFGPDPKQGIVGRVEATLLDRELVTMLGKDTAEISFELNGWAVPQSAGYAYPLVEGPVPGTSIARPLASLYPMGAGKAIFTSFHNESQITDDMETLLVEMILSL